MEFKKAEVKVDSLNNALQQKYPTDVQMYLDVPTEQINIEEFQELAVERVKLLRILEIVSVKGLKDHLWKDAVLEELQKQEVKYFAPLIKGYGDILSRRCDYLSHFILRLAYCRSEDLRRWFLARELDFFKLKFSNLLKKEEITTFMRRNNLNYTSISDEEKSNVIQNLVDSTSRIFNMDTSFYKVPFTQVLDLIRTRKVYVSKGFAYVPHTDLISILSTIFRSKLSYALSICAANISSLEGDERLSRVLKGLHSSYTGNDYNTRKTKTEVHVSSLNDLAKTSYPLCMRQMHDTFQKTHHLRYTARLQYCLFLKGIGLSLEDSLRFWREGFTQKPDIDVAKFEKEYSYAIRHNYGVEGKRANYTPHSCMKIITTSVGPGDNHGCPFKHFDINNLKQKLLSFNISVSAVTEICDFVLRGHYQLACTRYFEITHSVTNAQGISHPNQYFEESQKLLSSGAANEPTKKIKNTNIRKVTDDWGNESDFDMDVSAVLKNVEIETATTTD